MSDWRKFAVIQEEKGQNGKNGCKELEFAAHVCHVATAWSVVDSGSIRAGLVFDKSKLTDKRIQVVWLSPNHWNPGYRYGNVRFDFDWATIIGQKRSYWVEYISKDEYGVPACRILLTDVDRDQELEPYNPTIGDGQWWHDLSTGKHFWNGNITLEVMLETDLDLVDSTVTQFVKHHNIGCCIDPQMCEDRGMTQHYGGAIFIAGVVGNLQKTDGLKLTTVEGTKVKPTVALNTAWSGFRTSVAGSSFKFTGTVKDSDPVSNSLSRAFLNAYARKAISDQTQLSSLFATEADFKRSCCRVFGSPFGVNNLKWP